MEPCQLLFIPLMGNFIVLFSNILLLLFQFVCASGSAKRILRFATFVQKTLNINGKEELKDLCLTDRYSMYKIGSVLAVSVSDTRWWQPFTFYENVPI